MYIQPNDIINGIVFSNSPTREKFWKKMTSIFFTTRILFSLKCIYSRCMLIILQTRYQTKENTEYNNNIFKLKTSVYNITLILTRKIGSDKFRYFKRMFIVNLGVV